MKHHSYQQCEEAPKHKTKPITNMISNDPEIQVKDCTFLPSFGLNVYVFSDIICFLLLPLCILIHSPIKPAIKLT
jgi:hypothetical protein